MRDSFTFYRSFMEGLEGLPDDVYRRLVDAIMHYAMNDKEPDLTGLELATFKAWKANVDASTKRKENGRLGGRPINEKPLVMDVETNGYESETNGYDLKTNGYDLKTNGYDLKTNGYDSENQWLRGAKPNKKEKENIKENIKENVKEKEEGEEESKKPKIVKRFTPPTLTEVQEYVKEQGYNIDAQRFIDYYASKGWVVGKSPMKDWKAAVRNWSRSQRQETTAKDRQEKTALITREYDYEALERELLQKQGESYA